MKMTPNDLEGIKMDLSLQGKQSYSRNAVYMLMRHIEAQEEELARAAKSVDFLQDAVITQAMKLQRRRRKPTLWERVAKWLRNS